MPKNRLQALAFTTPAYRGEATRLLLEEANRVATDLRLPEALPITRSNLVATYISPPRLGQFMQTVGNITTSNYTYFVSVGCKFSFLERTKLEHEREKIQAQYLWPTNRLDTKAAYQVATQFLTAASMDVSALTRDCVSHIVPFTPEGVDDQHFVPIYSVWWEKKGMQGRGSVAEVEVCEPTKSLIQLHVSKPEYIMRKPLVVQNVNKLLSETNAPSQ